MLMDPSLDPVESSFFSISISPSHIDLVVEGAAAWLHFTLDSVAPLKIKARTQRRRAPLYRNQLKTLKKSARKLQMKWHRTQLQVFRKAWRDSLFIYLKMNPPQDSNCLLFLLNRRK